MIELGRLLERKSVKIAIIGAAGAAVSLALWGLGLLDAWENRTWDWRVRLMAGDGKATDDICLVLVDQQSLDWGREVNGWPWPWPREVFGAIINHCGRNGAKALAVDILFLEPSGFGVDDDKNLGKAVSSFDNIAIAMFTGKDTGSATEWPADVPKPDFSVSGENICEKLKAESCSRAAFPIPEVARNADMLCNVQLAPDPDGIYRRAGLVGMFDGQPMPSLGVGPFLAANEVKNINAESGMIEIGGRRVPVDHSGNAVLRYRGPSGTHMSYSAASVLQSEIRILSGEKPDSEIGDRLRDKYVFLGFSAPGIYDLRSAPVSGVYPGVEIHATLLDNLLSDDFIQSCPAWLGVFAVCVTAVAGAAVLTLFGNPAILLLLGSVVLAMPVGFSLGCYEIGIWLPLAVCELSGLAAIFISLAVNYATEGRQKRFIKNAFKQYLSPDVIDQLVKNPERLKLGGERRQLSIFFSDIQGFTSISEMLEPEALAALLNEYLTAMTDIVIDEGGTVDKYEGDAIIAFWNAPLEVPGHARRCVRAALRCQMTLAKMRPHFRKTTGMALHTRIGINTGDAVVGNFGSLTKFDYTMLGDAVNLAARLEGINKQFGTYTMISEYTRDMTEGAFATRELARVAVVGKLKPVVVFEPMFPKEYDARREVLEEFGRGLRLFYNAEFDEALGIFASLKEVDPPSAAYEKKTMQMIESCPQNWDGVWVMTSK